MHRIHFNINLILIDYDASYEVNNTQNRSTKQKKETVAL